MAKIVPASTRIHSSKVGNIDTDRLIRRTRWLRDNKSDRATKADSRKRLREMALEEYAIFDELASRHLPSCLPLIHRGNPKRTN